MSYKHVATAGDLGRFGCSLKVGSTHCGAARTMNGVEVHPVHGDANLTPRLKCRRCYRKAAKLTVLGPVYPD
jgi:hypothetical protein